jgi:hypothetical protein
MLAMPILDILIVTGIVLAFGALIAAMAWGVHQTKDLAVPGSLPVSAVPIPSAALAAALTPEPIQ